MVDKKINSKYNESVKVIETKDKTFFKLYRDGKLIYIGEVNMNEMVNTEDTLEKMIHDDMIKNGFDPHNKYDIIEYWNERLP